MSSPWIVRHAPRPRAAARLFCFPHAGVGASAYRLWPRALPDVLEVCAVQLPGRESRRAEAAVPSVAALVEALLPALLSDLDLPFAFFGHSLGAVLAAEVARALEARGGPRPGHLLVSARRPPHLPGAELPLHGLPDPAFLGEIQRRYGGIPAEILREPDLLALVLPTLRADVTALEQHRPPQRGRLACPITAFGGSEDAVTPRAHLEAWRDETRSTFRLRLFPGGHFYLDPRRAELLADVAATLEPLGRSPAEVPA